MENDTQTTHESESESQATITIQATSPSIKPSIEESERFIQFLNKRFNLNIRNDLIILIHETSPNLKGYFRSVRCSKIWKFQNESESISNLCLNTQNESENDKPLNSIVLSSHTLISTPYETLAHELAHYINFSNGVKDFSSNQYHNKHFKEQAEKLLLVVEKDNRRGYAYTTESEEFKKMVLDEFKPNETAFKIFQTTQTKKEKSESRLLLYVCGCGCKIRTARNENKPLKAVCSYCETEFSEVLK